MRVGKETSLIDGRATTTRSFGNQPKLVDAKVNESSYARGIELVEASLRCSRK